MVGNAQRILLPHLGLHPLDTRAVEQVIDGAIRAIDAWVIGEVGQPLLAVDAAGLAVAGDHRVFIPQQMQFAVRRILPAFAGVQAQELPQRQQIEIAADQPRRATPLEFIQQLDRGLHLFLCDAASRHVGAKARVQYRQLAAVA